MAKIADSFTAAEDAEFQEFINMLDVPEEDLHPSESAEPQSVYAPSMHPILKVQEIPFDDPESCNMFQPSPEKPFVATPAAIEAYQHETIMQCLRLLQEQAKKYEGIDYLQVFKSVDPSREDLWFMEDGPGAQLPPYCRPIIKGLFRSSPDRDSARWRSERRRGLTASSSSPLHLPLRCKRLPLGKTPFTIRNSAIHGLMLFLLGEGLKGAKE